MQEESGNTSFMRERENVLFYAARINEIADRIEDAYRLNHAGQVNNAFKQNLERDVIQCVILGKIRQMYPPKNFLSLISWTVREIIVLVYIY